MRCASAWPAKSWWRMAGLLGHAWRVQVGTGVYCVGRGEGGGNGKRVWMRVDVEYECRHAVCLRVSRLLQQKGMSWLHVASSCKL